MTLVYDVGGISLYHGDCLDVLFTLPDASVGAIITDPPYKLTSGGNTSGRMRGGMFDPSVYNNSGKLFACVPFSLWMPEAYRVLNVDADMYVMVNDKNIQEALNVATKAGFRLHNVLVWDKGNCVPNKWYMKCCEFTLYLWKGRARHIRNKGSSQINRTPNNVGKKVHPTEKPTALIRQYVENSTSATETVLDPFMGSGTAGVACVNTGREFIGIERDAGYFDIACKRITTAQTAPKQMKFIDPTTSQVVQPNMFTSD